MKPDPWFVGLTAVDLFALGLSVALLAYVAVLLVRMARGR